MKTIFRFLVVGVIFVVAIIVVAGVASGWQIPLPLISSPTTTTATPIETPMATEAPIPITTPTITSTPTVTPTEIAEPTAASAVVIPYAVLPQTSREAPFRCGFTTRITPGWCPAERPIWRYVYYCYGPFTGDGSVCSWDGGGTCQISWGCVASPDG